MASLPINMKPRGRSMAVTYRGGRSVSGPASNSRSIHLASIDYVSNSVIAGIRAWPLRVAPYMKHGGDSLPERKCDAHSRRAAR